MMKFKNILISLFFVILFSSFVMADSHIFDPKTFDYVKGDYSTINDWSKVDWTKIDFNNAEMYKNAKVYSNDEFYKNLPAWGYGRLDYNLVNYKSKSFDHDKVNSDKYGKDMGCVNCHIRIDGQQFSEDDFDSLNQATIVKVTYSKDGIKHSNGDFVSIPGTYPEGTTFQIVENKIEIILPPSTKEINVPKNNDVSVDTTGKFVVFGDNTFNGKLSFKQGQAYVKAGDEVRVNNYNIPNYDGKSDVNIYFNPTEKPKGNYVAISEDGLGIGSTKGNSVNVRPLPGNELFNMVKRDYSTKPPTLVPSEEDTMEITASDGDGLEVKSRADVGKTPMIEHHNDGGTVNIETGRLEVEIGKNFNVKFPRPLNDQNKGSINSESSVAFELTSDGNMEGVFRTSSSNRFEHLVDGKPVLSRSQGLEVSDSIAVNMMKTTADLQAKYPKIKFQKPSDDKENKIFNYNEITANMAQVWDQWLGDKPGIDKYLTDVEFVTHNNAYALKSTITAGERAMDSATRNDKPVRDHNVLGTLDHEFVHIMDDYVLSRVEQVNIETRQEWRGELIKLQEKYAGQDTSNPSHPYHVEQKKLQKKYDNHPGLKNPPHSLDELYQVEAVKIGKKALSDPEFKKLVADVDILSDKLNKEIYFAKIHPENLGSVAKAVNYNLNYQGFFLKNEKGMEKMGERLVELIKRKTGLYSYSFKSDAFGYYFPELSSTYNELPPERAKLHPNLAQLEYDRVMNADPPKWMAEKAKKRYEAILRPNGEYCKKNTCGPCIIYKATCSVK